MLPGAELEVLQQLKLSCHKTIFAVAVPAALFRVSSIFCGALQTSFVSHYGGTDMLAAFAAVGVTVKTACLLFAFMVDGVAAKVGRGTACESASEVRSRVRVYFASCLVLGAATAAALLCGRDQILRPFHLTDAVRLLALPYWILLALLVPLLLLNMSVSGTLQGLNHVGMSATLEAASAGIELVGTYVVLTHPGLDARTSRLEALAWVKWVVAGLHAAVGGALVMRFLAKDNSLHGQDGCDCYERLRDDPCDCDHRQGGETEEAGLSSVDTFGGFSASDSAHQQGGQGDSSENPLHVPLLGQSRGMHSTTRITGTGEGECRQEETGRGEGREGQEAMNRRGSWRQEDWSQALQHVKELVQDGTNVMVRSIVVQGSMWLVAVAAARLGTAPLAAHHILTQLWMLPSHLLGGFAVAGIVLGSRLAPCGGQVLIGDVDDSGRSRKAQHRLSYRLLFLSSSLGAVVGCALWVWRPAAMSAFHPTADVVAELAGPAWGVLCIMQPLTSALFTLTGLIYGAQYFSYMRNVLLVGFLGLFVPLLMWVMHRDGAVSWSELAKDSACCGVGLGAVWGVKLVFYAWQVVAEGVGVARAYRWY